MKKSKAVAHKKPVERLSPLTGFCFGPTYERRLLAATIASGLVGAPYVDQQDPAKVATIAIALADQIIAQTDPSYVAPVAPVPPLAG